MKALVKLLLLLLPLIVVAQQNNLVEYQFIKKDGFNEIQKEYLVFNDSDLYYINIKNDENLIFEDPKLDKTKINFEPIYIDLKRDTLYQNRLGIKEKNSSKVAWFILAEEKPKLVWEITKESKKILGYTTYKATAKFRGRDYIAWFTPDLSYNYGPWKLNGLPGLILKVENDMFSYEAKRIVLNSDKIPTIPLLKSLENSNAKYLLKDAVTLENNWLEYNRANNYASLPAGVKIIEQPLRQDERELNFDE